MGRVLLETGEYAKIPYYFENPEIRVFSVEELCYVLKENAFLLDREIINKKLIRWIDEVVKLPDLAASLYPFLHQKTSVGAFVGIILQYVGLYDEKTIRRIEELYNKSTNLNIYEKFKTRVDYMAAGGRFLPAILEYDVLLDRLPEEETSLRAKVLHNKGVALCGLFIFEEAAVQFQASYDLSGEEETLLALLAAKRLCMEEGDYISYAAGFPEYYDTTLALEKRVEKLRADWEESAGKQYLDERENLRQDGYMTRYYEETDSKILELKNRYRKNIGS